MKNYLKHHPWKVIEEDFHPEFNLVTESCLSIANGRMGQRASFEEQYSGETHQGFYLAGIFHTEKTRHNSSGNGYSAYSAKVLNSANWIGIDVSIDGEVLDLATCKLKGFKRVLNMKEGILERSFTARLVSGKEIKVKSTRFCSVVVPDVGAIRYSIQPLNFHGKITFTPYIDGDIMNRDAFGDEKFWVEISRHGKNKSGYVISETKNAAFRVCTGMKFNIQKNNAKVKFDSMIQEDEKYVGCTVEVPCVANDEIVLFKYSATTTSFYFDNSTLLTQSKDLVKASFKKGFEKLLEEHVEAWAKKWSGADITIEGDVALQQGIRFNIFHLFQTYTGADDRLNITPYGFSGEKNGGGASWNTEAYCLPFYLGTNDPNVARNLLIYRYKSLNKAIENASRIGFIGGAALFPLETVNGEECHHEPGMALHEVHRNGAIAYAIFDYVRYTGDVTFLGDYGLEILIGIARFWAQRAHWSSPQQKFVLHGVTGPNDYDINVNNNWYTNYIASWCLKYASEIVDFVRNNSPKKFDKILTNSGLRVKEEIATWQKIAENIYLPEDNQLRVFIQQDGYLEKELLNVDDLRPEHRPLYQKWSRDRILRSSLLKQADVLQGIYFFEDHFDEDTVRRNFDFYEPRTVHESPQSAAIHAILAAKLGKKEKAFEMYLRMARFNLDDYNDNTKDGLHIATMAGTWLTFVEGFGGLRAEKDLVSFNPYLPEFWQGYSFQLMWKGNYLQVRQSNIGTTIVNQGSKPLQIKVKGIVYEIGGQQELNVL
jgi:maltose phosphorylase